MILVDTNVLIYAVNVDASHHQASRAFVEAVRNKRIAGAVVPQILLEFFAVVTDGRRIEKPLGADTAWSEVEKFRMIFRVLDPGPAALDRLEKMVQNACIEGPDVFDAWLAAQAQACGVPVICTYNTGDFSGFPVTAQTPEQLLT